MKAKGKIPKAAEAMEALRTEIGVNELAELFSEALSKDHSKSAGEHADCPCVRVNCALRVRFYGYARDS